MPELMEQTSISYRNQFRMMRERTGQKMGKEEIFFDTKPIFIPAARFVCLCLACHELPPPSPATPLPPASLSPTAISAAVGETPRYLFNTGEHITLAIVFHFGPVTLSVHPYDSDPAEPEAAPFGV